MKAELWRLWIFSDMSENRKEEITAKVVGHAVGLSFISMGKECLKRWRQKEKSFWAAGTVWVKERTQDWAVASFQNIKLLFYLDSKYTLEEYSRIDKLKIYNKIAVSLEIWKPQCRRNKRARMFSSEGRNLKGMPVKSSV